MKFRNIGYMLGCFAMVAVLMMVTPNFAHLGVKVNEQLRDQAQEQGLFTVEMPAGATNTVKTGCEIDGIVTAEIVFMLKDVYWDYRCAPMTAEGDALPNLSGVEGEAKTQEAQVKHCPALISVYDDGVGTIIWYDAAAGLAYSLAVAENAEADALQSIANLMYVPAQTDV